MALSQQQTTLIIKLGAMGDFLLALGPFQSIRRAYPQDHLILWTTPAYARVAKLSGLFDEIWAIPRFSSWNMVRLLSWLRNIKRRGVDRIFDLQTSSHTSRYYYGLVLMGWRGDFSGIARGASWRHTRSERNSMHTMDRQKDQLMDAQVQSVPVPNLDFLVASGSRSLGAVEFSELIKNRGQPAYCLIVPGGSQHRPLKRWPVAQWKKICDQLIKRSICPVLIGGPDEKDLRGHFEEFGSGLIDLIGKTSLETLAWIGRSALGAIGNDTGAMHLLALSGCPTLSLFCTRESDPGLCAPRGDYTDVLFAPSLLEISETQVMEHLDALRERAQKKES